MTWYRLSKLNGGIITHTTRRTQSRCICRRGVQERGSGGDHIARHDMTLHFMILSHQESTGHAVKAGNRPVRVGNQNRCMKKHKARKDSLVFASASAFADATELPHSRVQAKDTASEVVFSMFDVSPAEPDDLRRAHVT